jgi:anaerobic magnesium-protoporphyrin IX monomethyl ester cyclase
MYTNGALSKMKILIVAPRYKPYGQFYELPLGLAYISSSLKAQGHDVTFINLNEHPDDTIFFQHIGSNDILCTGGLSVHYRQIKQILDNAKRANPKIKTIVGGGLICSEPELMAQNLSADLLVVGEGELIDLNAIGIVRMESVRSLDTLPFPDYEGLGVRGYLDRQLCGDEHYLYPFDKPRCLPIISSRSCPHNCSFCFHPLGKVYRQRSLDSFFKEVEYLIETYQVNMLAVLDELISADPERLSEFCRRIKKYNINWMTQARADSLNPDTIRLMKASGCHQVSIGVESGSNTILASMSKHTTIEVIGQALQWLYEAGIGIQGNFIFGDKNETRATAQETLDWWLAHRHLMLNLTHIIPYPGCALYNYAIERNLILDKKHFIEQGCPVVPLTPEIGTITRMIEAYKPLGILYAQVVFSKMLGMDPHRGRLYHTRVRCPHCQNEVEYQNLYDGATNGSMVRGAYRIGCRYCNQRFDIRKEDLCR